MWTRGIDGLLNMLAQAGVRFIFGNPGTTELPLNDALIGDDRFRYILAPQEVPVMAMADGYAMASGELGVVNLHISCGLGNAMGMLYNAYREGTPLLVTAGQQDRRLMFEEPILWSDLARVARPWTKWSVEVQRVEDLPAAVRRARQLALTPPTGPVFMSLPVDVQTESGELDLTLPPLLNTRVRPPQDSVKAAVKLLSTASRPAILTGSRVVERDAVDELVAVAEILGAPAISESGTTHGRLPFPAHHPLYDGGLPLWSPEVRERLANFDVVLVAGMDLLRQYVYHEPSRAIPEHIQLVHLDEDPYQIGKNYPVAAGIVGDTKVALAELAEELRIAMSEAQTDSAKQRGDALAERHRQEREELWQRAEQEGIQVPLSPLALMAAVARAIPEDVAVVEEAVTTTGTYLERLGALRNTSGYFGHRGWGLGWGLGCALGVQLAWPRRPVLALLGEGAALYGIQGLWSAAHYQIPVTFVICNNAQYQILKIGAAGLQLPKALQGEFEGLDLSEPEVDFVGLARSFGVEAERAGNAEELTELVRNSLAGDVPRLIDVPVQRSVPGRLNYG